MQYPGLSEMLRQAIAIARGLGLTESADRLQDRTEGAYTSSSEYLGEVGDAIQEFLAREGNRLPGVLTRRLDECLYEVGRVWPKYRPK